MSLVEVLLRFAVVAAVFAVSMVLLRRYGKSRQRTVQEHGGLQVTSRVTLGRGVQLLLVKAGKADFLVSSGGRIAMTPVVSPAPATTPAVEYAGTDAVERTEPAPPTRISVNAEEHADIETEPQLDSGASELLVDPSFARGPMGWAQRAGYRLGLWVRARVVRPAPQENSPSFADVLSQFDHEEPAESPAQGAAPSVVHAVPLPRSAPTLVTFQGPVRADLEPDSVAVPAQPVSPTTHAVLAYAVQEKPRRRPRRRAPKAASAPGGISGVPGSRATSSARVSSSVEPATPEKKAPARATRVPRKASATTARKNPEARVKATAAKDESASSPRATKKVAPAAEEASPERAQVRSRNTRRTRTTDGDGKASASSASRGRTGRKAKSPAGVVAAPEDATSSAPPRSSVGDPLTPAASMVPNLSPSTAVDLTLPTQEVAPA